MLKLLIGKTLYIVFEKVIDNQTTVSGCPQVHNYNVITWHNSIDNKIKTTYYEDVNKIKGGNQMSHKEYKKLKRAYSKATYKQLMRLHYERNHDVSEQRFILRRIPLC